MTLNFLLAVCALLIPAAALADVLDIEGYIPFHPAGKPLRGLVITLDPGHGGFAHQPGYTGSARGVNSRAVENDLNMLVAVEVRHYLHEAGATVHMTRWDDRKVAPVTELERSQELGARTKLAEDTRSHLFIAIHHNATTSPTADGVVILVWPTDSKGTDQPLEHALASVLREEVERYVHHTGKFDAYVNNHPLVAGSDIPSACVEFGFLTNPDFDAWVTQQGAHRAEARGLYEGIVRMWREHRDELEALRAGLFPGPAARTTSELGDAAAPDDQPETAPAEPSARPGPARPVARLVRMLWPFSKPPRDEVEAQFLLDQYRRSVTDATFFYLDLKARREGGRWLVIGATNNAMLGNAAVALLRAAGCGGAASVIETLPSPRVGEKRFGVVQIPMALTWGRPAEGRDPKTQLLLGERVYLLDQTPDGGYLLLQGGDGYWGWVRGEAILRLDEKGFTDWSSARTVTLTQDVMIDDLRLPAGARLRLEEGGAGETVTLRIPMGVRATKGDTVVTVPSRSVLIGSSDGAQGMAAARAAAEYLTTPYVLGGRSRLGIDCSGLTGVAWAAGGVTLPRDAHQQVLVGRLVATPWYRPALQPGDLVFFLDESGKVSHTGVSLGGSRFIHASPPEVQISSFDPTDPLYSASWRQRFAFARRPAQ